MAGIILRSIQVGLPRLMGGDSEAESAAAYGVTEDEGAFPDGTWISAICKAPVEGPVWLGKTNLRGDAQADLKHHGGVDMAVLAYSAEHYPLWRDELGRPDFSYGAFGENFTIEGLDEDRACIGDVYSLGDVVVQVSQPRSPCWKLARRWQIKDLALRVERNGRSGWYFRVLQEGYVEAGEALTLVERPYPEYTVRTVARVMAERRRRSEEARALAACEALSEGWRRRLGE